MALTAAQRRKLPRSAFVYAPKSAPRSSWKYPVPTRAQAKRAGISEGNRLRIARSAMSYAGRRSTSGTPARVGAVVHRRAPRSAAGQADGDRPGRPGRTFESFAPVFEPAPLGPPRSRRPPPTRPRSKQPPHLGVCPPLPPLPPRQAPRRPRFLPGG